METAEHEVFILSILFILSKRSSLVAAGRAGPSVVELPGFGYGPFCGSPIWVRFSKMAFFRSFPIRRAAVFRVGWLAEKVAEASRLCACKEQRRDAAAAFL
jgi:hypothetical protein